MDHPSSRFRRPETHPFGTRNPLPTPRNKTGLRTHDTHRLSPALILPESGWPCPVVPAHTHLGAALRTRRRRRRSALSETRRGRPLVRAWVPALSCHSSYRIRNAAVSVDLAWLIDHARRHSPSPRTTTATPSRLSNGSISSSLESRHGFTFSSCTYPFAPAFWSRLLFFPVLYFWAC